MTHITEALECVICGNAQRREVYVGLIEVDEPPLRPKWDAAPRCVDRDACRQRAFDLIEREEGKP